MQEKRGKKKKEEKKNVFQKFDRFSIKINSLGLSDFYFFYFYIDNGMILELN